MNRSLDLPSLEINSMSVPGVTIGFWTLPRALEPSSAMDRLADLFTGVFLLFVVYFGAVFVQSSYAVDLRAPVLDWVVWPFQIAVRFSFLINASSGPASASGAFCKTSGSTP